MSSLKNLQKKQPSGSPCLKKKRSSFGRDEFFSRQCLPEVAIYKNILHFSDKYLKLDLWAI